MKLLSILLFLISLLFIGQSFSKEDKLEDLKALRKALIEEYVFYGHKQRLLKFSADHMLKHYAYKILKAKNQIERDNLLKEVVSRFQDSHLSLSLPQYPTWHSVGFFADYVGGEYYVSRVYQNMLPDGADVKIGDRVVSVNGKSVDHFYQNFVKRGVSSVFSEPKKRFNGIYMFTRNYRIHHIPTEQDMRVTFQRGSGKKITYDLTWKSFGTLPTKLQRIVKNEIPKDLVVKFPFHKYRFNKRYLGVSNECAPYKEVNFFEERVIEANNKKIGYIKIPTWVALNVFEEPIDGKPAFTLNTDLFVKCFGEAIKTVLNTEALIIDQIGNTGGNLVLAGNISGYFFNDKANRPKGRYLATDRFFEDFHESYNRNCMGSHYAWCGFWAKELILIEETQSKLTPRHSVFYPSDPFIKLYQPSYLKPVFVLNDGFSCSTSEYFSVIMGINNRAEFVGTRTCGTGGGNYSYNGLGKSKFSLVFANNIFYESAKGRNIEGFGIKPTIPYPYTFKDFISGNKYFIKFAVREALKRI